MITTDIYFGGKTFHERIDNMVYACFSEACNISRKLNEDHFGHVATALKPKSRYKVYEINETIPVGSRRGRDADELLDISSIPFHYASENSSGDDSQAATASATDPWTKYLSNGYLSLRGKDIVNCDVQAIVDICCRAEGRVTQLGLSDNRLREDGTLTLTIGLLNTHFCRNICALFLSDNRIGDSGAAVIAGLLASRALPLIKLGLNSNCISDVGVRALADALRPAGRVSNGCASHDDVKFCSLEVLGLSRNDITTDGAVYFAGALSVNVSLKRVFLNYNPYIGDAGGIAISRAAQAHPALERLGLAFCGLESAGGERLIDVAKSSRTIERVCVSGNKFCAETEFRMKEISLFNFASIK